MRFPLEVLTLIGWFFAYWGVFSIGGFLICYTCNFMAAGFSPTLAKEMWRSDDAQRTLAMVFVLSLLGAVMSVIWTILYG